MIATLTRTEARLYLRDPLNAVLGIALPAVILLGLGAVPALREPTEVTGGVPFTHYFAAPLLAISLALTGLQVLPTTLATYRERGMLRRYSATPMSPLSVLLVQLMVNLAAAAVATVVLLIVAVGALGVPAPRHPLGFVVAFVVGTSAVFALGLLIAALAPRAKVATGIGSLAFLVANFFAGVYLPAFLLPDAVVAIGRFVPPGIGALADAWIGAGPDPLVLGVMALIAVAATGAAARLFRWE